MVPSLVPVTIKFIQDIVSSLVPVTVLVSIGPVAVSVQDQNTDVSICIPNTVVSTQVQNIIVSDQNQNIDFSIYISNTVPSKDPIANTHCYHSHLYEPDCLDVLIQDLSLQYKISNSLGNFIL